MRIAHFCFAVCLFACNGNTREDTSIHGDSAIYRTDSAGRGARADEGESTSAKTYSNERFRDVTIQKIDSNRFVIQGKAQIFEANFGWVVEDGHHELKKGFEMTDAGAPAWGDFMFPLEVEKRRPNSRLTLILYESSAKDGSRQHELAIPLP